MISLTWLMLFLTIGLFLNFFANFWNFEIMVLYIVTVKCLFYRFNRIAFNFYTGIKYDITNLACAFFDDRTIFWFLANFLNFEIMLWYIVTVKCLFSYSFNRIVFKLHTGIKYDITHLGCAFFDTRTIFEFLANFWNNGILCSNCKMPLLLQL